MEYQVIIDADYLLNISKKINDTTIEITNSINSLKKINSELNTNIEDQNINSFNNNFSDYLTSLSNLTTFYDEITGTVNRLVKEYENIDESNASELKKQTNKKSTQ